MPLSRPAIFDNLPDKFTATFGEDVEFTTSSGVKIFTCIIREEEDVLSDNMGGVGIDGPYAYLRISSADAEFLAENDTLVYQSQSFKIASAGRQDGCGMTVFDLARTDG